MSIPEDKFLKRIRSFARCGGKATPGQKAAIEKNWLHHGYELSQGFIKLPEKRVILEIGFGMGEALSSLATQHPDTQFIGIEVYRPSVGSLLMKIEKQGLQNIKLFKEDAVEVLEHCIPNHQLDAILLFFPDPWHKKRHHKRRLISPDFIELISKKLKPTGYFHVATDWEDYARHTEETLLQFPQFKKQIPENFIERPQTKYEARGKRLGHAIWDLIYVLELS